jgi:MFS transporter, ACS family, pantothenate transporter
VVQAVAPNFVWKTTDFPRAAKGYTWSTVLNALLSKSPENLIGQLGYTILTVSSVVWTAVVQLLLAWDRKRQAKAREVVSEDSEANSQDEAHDDGKTSGYPAEKKTELN